MNRYTKKIVGALTRPVSRKVQLYSTPEYKQEMKDKKNPRSPRYKKNVVDKFVDRIFEI